MIIYVIMVINFDAIMEMILNFVTTRCAINIKLAVNYFIEENLIIIIKHFNLFKV